jgi:hypothetical protein
MLDSLVFATTIDPLGLFRPLARFPSISYEAISKVLPMPVATSVDRERS